MRIQDKNIVITGAGSGIGAALARRFHREGARHLVVVDRDPDNAAAVAREVGGQSAVLDVADEQAVRRLVATTELSHGGIDLFVSNAGYVTVGGLEIANEELQKMWDVHVMAHVYAARAVLPGMIERGQGYILNTASAAGLLTQLGSLAYSVTKHAAVAFAEWIAISHAHQGIGVSVLCPQAVATNIRENSPSRDQMKAAGGVAAGDGVLESDDVAQCVIDALAEERFWVLPHAEVAEYHRRKATDVDRWIRGMRRFQNTLYEGRSLPGDWLVEGRDDD